MKRRDVLKGVVLGTAATVLGGKLLTTEAEAKSSKKDVEYRGKPKGNQRCTNCALFVKPNKCKNVKGSVSPLGWCNIWVKKS